MSFDLIIELVLQYRYWILLPLAVFEGPIITFVAGTLIALGYLNIFIVYPILFLGDIIPDISYYFFGRYGEKKTLISRYAAKVGVTEEHFDTIRNIWYKHPSKTMLLSKFAYGLSTPLLISAGIVGMPLRRFLSYSVPITIVQSSVLLGLGYYFGNYFKFFSDTVQFFQIAIAGLVIVAITYYFLTRYMRKKFMEEQTKEVSG